jgi:signal transduction histidine kinase
VVLALGLDPRAGAPPGGGAGAELRLRLILGLVGIGAIGAAWALGIRAREMSSALEVERQQRAHLEEMSLAAAGLAHETKNPLGIISGLAQRIEHDPGLSDKTRGAAEQIIDAADRAAARLGEFMSYAKTREPDLAPVDVRDVLDKALSVLEHDFEDAGVAVTATVGVPRIVADTDMLLQILLNLLLNSLQASSRGGRVVLRVDRRGRLARLSVDDDGAGIDPELQKEVFKPYVTGRPEGHGLGLSIVKRLAERQGWAVRLESGPGAGTRVTFDGIEVPPAEET